MIKTINTKHITDIMLEAQNVIDGTTYSDPLSFKDAADIFIAMAEAAPAVEPASDQVPMPHNADQAQAMILVAANWLKTNAPERLVNGDGE